MNPDLHVPGHWECPLCGFQQINQILAPAGVFVDAKPELRPCPNDGRDMIPLTWKRACENQETVLSQLFSRLDEKQAAIAELNERCSSHLISMLDLAGHLTREIARWKSAHRQVSRELLAATAAMVRGSNGRKTIRVICDHCSGDGEVLDPRGPYCCPSCLGDGAFLEFANTQTHATEGGAK